MCVVCIIQAKNHFMHHCRFESLASLDMIGVTWPSFWRRGDSYLSALARLNLLMVPLNKWVASVMYWLCKTIHFAMAAWSLRDMTQVCLVIYGMDQLEIICWFTSLRFTFTLHLTGAGTSHHDVAIIHTTKSSILIQTTHRSFINQKQGNAKFTTWLQLESPKTLESKYICIIFFWTLSRESI